MLSRERRRLNLDFFSTLKGVVSLLKDPNQTDSVYDIEDGLRHTDATKLALDYVKFNTDVERIIQERYVAPTPDLEALLKCPEGSLGYEYASHMKEAGFDPEFYRKIKVEDDISYLLFRIRQTHDIWHIVTGFSTDVAGELGLQAFYVAQTRRTMSVVLTAGGLLSTLIKSPEHLNRVLDHISQGYRMGMNAKPFLAQKWEENWDKALSEWRAELGIGENLPSFQAQPGNAVNRGAS